MRWLLGLLPFAVAASCGGVISGSNDGGTDAAGGACNTSADCPNGGDCAYSETAGCSAQKKCFPPKQQCKGALLCACDGTTVFDDCNGAASKPIAHQSLCGGPPPLECGSGLACEMCDVSGFSPVPQSPPFASVSTCSASQITDLVTACISSTATQATCGAWQQANAGPCASCAMTQTTSANWGPIVCGAQGSCAINSGGCIDLTLKEVSQEKGLGGAGSCGDAYSDELGCIAYACGACVGADSAACSSSATVNECQPYVQVPKTSPLCGGLDATVCFPQNNADFVSFINVFCGTGP